MKLTQKSPLGNTGLPLPQVIYGTSYLGNLYKELHFDEKLALMRKWFECTVKPVVIDSAGKYGAGLALEVIGRGLAALDIDPEDIIISNKLGWYRIPLTTDEPTFEPGAWVGLEHDCEQRFGYEGIMECFQQGNELLGGKYRSEVVSIHDPDEYLLAASDPADRDIRFLEVLDSYKALFELKTLGEVKAVGIGSKDWTIIRELYQHVPFDWVMFANSFTLYSHPADLLKFMDLLYDDGVGIVNSALFHGGFLTGGQQFDYQAVDPVSEKGEILFKWRDAFYNLCRQHKINPVDACIHFGSSHPAIVSIALNTSKPEKMIKNAEILTRIIPGLFWDALKREGIIDPSFPYL